MSKNNIKNITEKPWGREELLEINEHYIFKRLLMKKGCRCSYQFHKFKKESVYCLSGQLTIILEDKSLVLKPGEYTTLDPGVKHRMYSSKEDTYYLEASYPFPDDVVRIEDDYHRK